MDLPAAPRPALRQAGPRLPARLLRLAGDDRLVAQLRAGSPVAFEVIFDRHHRGVLAFCRHMLGSVDEAEDAVQHTFMAAYRALAASGRPVQLRPWLYVIARNRCLSVLRARREHPVGALVEPATEHLAAEVQRRQDLRDLLQDVAGLPEDQRAALVLAEVGDVSHDEIAQILGCARGKVKALVFQARTSLNASREAREASCPEIREQIANLRGGSLRRNVLRRHLRECAGCSEFRRQVAAQRSALAVVLPVAPSVGLKQAVLGSALSGG
ncbi:MAG: RNA polymerase sigma factor, partial [Solirubrobacteraceae bacterium]